MGRKPTGNRLRQTPVAHAHPRLPRQHLSLSSWRDQHLYSFFSSLGRLAARPWATALTALVMGLALALPLLFLVALDNARSFSAGWQDARDISVFLRPDQDAGSAASLAARIGARSDVLAVKQITPQQGLDEFRAMSGFSAALDVLQFNPLPQVLIVTPREAAAGSGPPVVAELKADAAVDLVQYDAAWRRRLGAILGFVQRVVAVLAGLLSLATLLVVGNTVRMDIASRSDEIAVMQVIGASSGFVRRPFLYAGIWYGLFSGIAAVLVLFGVEALLSLPVQQLLDSYEHRFALRGLAVPTLLAVPVASAALGWLGAMLATARHLAEGQPE